MAHSNAIQLFPTSNFSFKLLIAIKDYALLLASALAEARQLEQETRKTSGNW